MRFVKIASGYYFYDYIYFKEYFTIAKSHFCVSRYVRSNYKDATVKHSSL